mgnify:CR=1 FL=1
MSSRKDASEAAVRQHRKAQQDQDAKDRAAAKSAKDGKAKQPVQAGHREEPENPLPSQRLEKPGIEAQMELRPRYEAPDYRGSGKLQDMRAVVTGGDSGIGRAVALLFAREGADVAIVYLNEHEDAQETKRHVEAEGRRCLLIPGDVSDGAFCEKAVAKAVKEFGGLDILVNNAAFQMHAQKIEDVSDERLDLTLQTNIGGYFRMARAAVPHMKQGGSIINTGSVTGLEGSSNLLDYSATKGAVILLTQARHADTGFLRDAHALIGLRQSVAIRHQF